MYVKYFLFIIIFVLLGTSISNSQNISTHQDIEIHFRFDKHNLDPDYMDNRQSLQDFAHKIDSIGISKIDSIVIVSQSSPEGVYEHNLMLSQKRANTMQNYIQEVHPELIERLYVYPDGESWGRLREYVKNDTLMKKETIEKVLSIIDSDINIGTKKWRMEQLPVYRYLIQTYYPRIRNSIFCILYYSEFTPQMERPELTVNTELVKPRAVTITQTVPQKEIWSNKIYLKTNAVGLGMGITNIAAEVDCNNHWSFALPIYYSAWNYFKTTVKFRTLSIQPEIRYWFSKNNNGFFTGAHLGLAYYNFAFNGNYRYQDHDGKTPAAGGGLSIGYRLPVSKNKRWLLEMQLGAGAYKLHYDKFFNTNNTKDGLLVENIKKTYWGLDQAAVSLSYSFDLKKKGVKL
mgnify:FL=1